MKKAPILLEDAVLLWNPKTREVKVATLAQASGEYYHTFPMTDGAVWPTLYGSLDEYGKLDYLVGRAWRLSIAAGIPMLTIHEELLVIEEYRVFMEV